MELFHCRPPSGKDKYPTWQYWQFPAREPLCLLVQGVGFHRHIINFYQTCIEHLWHIKQSLYKKKLPLSACVWATSDLKADWKYLCKNPFLSRGEKYKLVYALGNVYKERILLKVEWISISFSDHFRTKPTSGYRRESQVNTKWCLWMLQGCRDWQLCGCS